MKTPGLKIGVHNPKRITPTPLSAIHMPLALRLLILAFLFSLICLASTCAMQFAHWRWMIAADRPALLIPTHTPSTSSPSRPGDTFTVGAMTMPPPLSRWEHWATFRHKYNQQPNLREWANLATRAFAFLFPFTFLLIAAASRTGARFACRTSRPCYRWADLPRSFRDSTVSATMHLPLNRHCLLAVIAGVLSWYICAPRPRPSTPTLLTLRGWWYPPTSGMLIGTAICAPAIFLIIFARTRRDLRTTLQTLPNPPTPVCPSCQYPIVPDRQSCAECGIPYALSIRARIRAVTRISPLKPTSDTPNPATGRLAPTMRILRAAIIIILVLTVITLAGMSHYELNPYWRFDYRARTVMDWLLFRK